MVITKIFSSNHNERKPRIQMVLIISFFFFFLILVLSVSTNKFYTIKTLKNM